MNFPVDPNHFESCHELAASIAISTVNKSSQQDTIWNYQLQKQDEGHNLHHILFEPKTAQTSDYAEEIKAILGQTSSILYCS